ncbi:MAG: hypothetical protein ACP5M4_04035 [Acidobacteriaceae bacterium]
MNLISMLVPLWMGWSATKSIPDMLKFFSSPSRHELSPRIRYQTAVMISKRVVLGLVADLV